ncbi:uncharacterized protein LOC114358578 [Ostrinia furnacalis]|uniref:uncharacterized protein LOC114358578 n=1 Tax=Ostrinia furnacalis TaxID=93504 RepID=UPI0010393E28|nr:uncharacterized protein LOC114358578 [Ostrinia furnacalis]
MCYIFNCFGWLLDLIQRVITFFLACWMSLAICIGLTVAAVAGIAYGYNYQMAEFLTFTRSDVTVYMRRGQFYDRPDVKPRYISRRTGDEEEAFPAHAGGDDDYIARDKVVPDSDNSKPLPASWGGIRGVHQFADKLYKYTTEARRVIFEDSGVQADVSTETQPSPRDYYKLTASPSRLITKLISITPNVAISTAIWKSGDAKIIMRNFQISTMKDMDSDSYKAYHSDYIEKDEQEETRIYHNREEKENKENKNLPRKQKVHRIRPIITPDLRLRDEYEPTRSEPRLNMRHWGPTTTPIFQDYSEDVDEDRIVYKPG